MKNSGNLEKWRLDSCVFLKSRTKRRGEGQRTQNAHPKHACISHANGCHMQRNTETCIPRDLLAFKGLQTHHNVLEPLAAAVNMKVHGWRNADELTWFERPGLQGDEQLSEDSKDGLRRSSWQNMEEHSPKLKGKEDAEQPVKWHRASWKGKDEQNKRPARC